ncbi:MAG: glycerophosphodiester phosphodiesterase [Pseudomonadota bacterium]
MHRPPLSWLIPPLIAHRCGGALAPENTLAGLRIAAALGCSAVEFDVMLSADGAPWLIHDEMLERTSNGTGRVCAKTDTELYGLDAGVKHHPAFADEPLPRLDDAAQLARQLNLMVNLELKPAYGFDEATGKVVAQYIVDNWAPDRWPLVSSFSFNALAAARRSAPELAIACLWERPPGNWRQHVDALGAIALHCAASELSDSVLEEAHQHGIAVLCYTVNDAASAEKLLKRGVSAVFTDRIDKLARYCNNYLPQLKNHPTSF